MRSVKNKFQEHMKTGLADIRNCSLHEVHYAFARGLDAFGSEAGELLRSVYYYFKSAVCTVYVAHC